MSKNPIKKGRIPPVRNYTIDLSILDSGEQKTLNEVIQRDLSVNKEVDDRLSSLKKEIQCIRKAGALTGEDKQTAICARCKYRFWLVLVPFVDHGTRCFNCKFKVCRKCRFKQANNMYLCSLCLKQRQEKWLTGDWLFGGQCRGLFGSDLLRASLRDKGLKRQDSLPSRHPELDSSDSGGDSGEEGQQEEQAPRVDEKSALVVGRRRNSYSTAEEIRNSTEFLAAGNEGHDGNYSEAKPYDESEDEDNAETLDVLQNSLSSIHSASSSVSTSHDAASLNDTKSQSSDILDEEKVPECLADDIVQISQTDSDTVNYGPKYPTIPKTSPEKNEEGGCGSSFEERYNSDVSRLMEVMTGAQMGQGQDSDSSPKPQPSRKGRRELPQPPGNELTRDSDSGVTSSHTSRTNTPEQRHGRPVAPGNRLPVPAISVTNSGEESRGEEEDDLDELFTQHRNMLGSRSSLADSRESLYSVYSNAGEVNYGRIPVQGDVMFHMNYDHRASTLEVHVKACRELAPVDTKHNRSDPYVKTYLLPDKSRGSKRKTKIKKHTLSPTFDEVLKYPIPKNELEARTLWLTVWHNDRFGRNDFLGEVTVPMDYYQWDMNNPRWYPLQERLNEDDPLESCYKGDLVISLKYVTPDLAEGVATKKKSLLKAKSKTRPSANAMGELHAKICEAQNLTAMRGAAGSNAFCKGYLLPDEKHLSKQKTPVIKRSINPKWAHTLVWPADLDQLHTQALELTIWDHDKLTSNDFLGGVRLSLGQGPVGDRAPEWMDARADESEVWRSLINHPNEWIDAQLPLRPSMGKQVVKK